MGKKVLIINGHPNEGSFNFGVATAYENGARSVGAEVKHLVVSELKFNPNLEFGYQKRTPLEPDLIAAWEAIQWAEHLVWVHPVWWGRFTCHYERIYRPSIFARYGFSISRKFYPMGQITERQNGSYYHNLGST